MEKGQYENQKINKVIFINNDNCARCRSCIRKCRYHVLEMINNEQGLHVEVVHPEKCTGCGVCIDACCFNALQFAIPQKESI